MIIKIPMVETHAINYESARLVWWLEETCHVLLVLPTRVSQKSKDEKSKDDIRSLRDCPSQMNEHLLISNSKRDANQQIGVYLWGTVMLGVYYIMARIIVAKYIDQFK